MTRKSLQSILGWVALLVFQSVESQADLAFGLVAGWPARVGARGAWHMSKGRWGSSVDLAYPSVTSLTKSTESERLLALMANVRFDNNLTPFRTYEFAGFSMLSGPYGKASGSYYGFNFGGGMDVRWIPGAGLFCELGAIAPLSDFGAEVALMGWGPIVQTGLVFWFP